MAQTNQQVLDAAQHGATPEQDRANARKALDSASKAANSGDLGQADMLVRVAEAYISLSYATHEFGDNPDE